MEGPRDVRCLQCHDGFKVSRGSASAKLYVLQHENSNSHIRKIKNKQAASSENGGRHEVSPVRCTGFLIGAGTSRLCRIRSSCQMWVSSGLVRTLTSGNSPMSVVTFRTGQEDQTSPMRLWIQHSSCAGDAGVSSVCQLCISLANNKELEECISRWAARIDLITYASVLRSGSTDEKRQFEVRLRESDYHQWNLKARRDIEALLMHSEAWRVVQIRHCVASIPHVLRTPTLQQWIDVHLGALPAVSVAGDDVELRAVSSLVSTFTGQLSEGVVDMKNLDLAAQVASGKLNASKAARIHCDPVFHIIPQFFFLCFFIFFLYFLIFFNIFYVLFKRFFSSFFFF